MKTVLFYNRNVPGAFKRSSSSASIFRDSRRFYNTSGLGIWVLERDFSCEIVENG